MTCTLEFFRLTLKLVSACPKAPSELGLPVQLGLCLRWLPFSKARGSLPGSANRGRQAAEGWRFESPLQGGLSDVITPSPHGDGCFLLLCCVTLCLLVVFRSSHADLISPSCSSFSMKTTGVAFPFP